MSCMVADLFQRTKAHISLFMVLPWALDEHTTLSAEEAFVPNVAMASDLSFQMLEFFGRVMGIALRNEV